MDFRAYYLSLDRPGRERLAGALDTSLAYLSQLAHGHRAAGAKILLGIEEATAGAVTPRELPRTAPRDRRHRMPPLPPPDGDAEAAA